MSRPKPQILLDNTDRNSYDSLQVLSATGVFAVFYNGLPINIRSLNKLGFNKAGKPSTPKYRKTIFPNVGHAINLADKLNQLFKTTNFEVFLLTNGQTIKKDI
jgi:hypothetical protein